MPLPFHEIIAFFKLTLKRPIMCYLLITYFSNLLNAAHIISDLAFNSKSMVSTSLQLEILAKLKLKNKCRYCFLRNN